MRRKGISIAVMGLLTAGLGWATACSNDATAPEDSLLAGLTRLESNDTVTNEPPPGPVEPGSFHGSIFGLAVTGGIGDTLSSAVRLEGVAVTVYLPGANSENTGLPTPGPEVASVTTDANGEFQVPQLPYGRYLVTITLRPPHDAVYIGSWGYTYVTAQSNMYPWWVYLPRKQN